MAVWAEHAEILDAVVVPHAVSVVDLDAERFALPFAYSTYVAPILKQAGLQQPSLD